MLRPKAPASHSTVFKKTLGTGKTMPLIFSIMNTSGLQQGSGVLRSKSSADARPGLETLDRNDAYELLKSRLAPLRLFHRRPQHDAMQIHGGHRAVFDSISRPLVRHPGFKQAL